MSQSAGRFKVSSERPEEQAVFVDIIVSIIFIFYVAAICDLVHEVETILDPC